MANIGGSVESVSLAGTAFAATADADFSINMGGDSNETQPNGDGVTGRTVKTKTPWKVTGIVLSIDWAQGDMSLLQSLADGDNFPIVFTLADDTKLNGTGQIQGDLTGSTMTSTVAIECAGPGKLTEA